MRASSSKAERSLSDLLGADHYIVVGANSGGDTVERYLNTHGKTVAVFADLDTSRAGGLWRGRKIIRLDEVPAALTGDTAIVIGSFRHSEIGARLVRDLGVDPASVYPFVNDMFARHYAPDLYHAHAGEIARVRALLSDEDSRAYFDRVIAFYRTLDPLLLTPNPKAYGLYGYDAPEVKPRPNAVIVDCGAFNGDTCAFYLEEAGPECFIFAIEAFMPNFLRLVDSCKSLSLNGRVKPLHLAVGAQTGPILLEGDPNIPDACAHISTTAHELGASDLVLCETLDRLFETHFDTKIDLVKIDVEGADLDVLRGGENLLRRDRPMLAVASYHAPEHIWQIPLKAAEALGPCRVYAGHDPKWIHQIHYIFVPGGADS